MFDALAVMLLKKIARRQKRIERKLDALIVQGPLLDAEVEQLKAGRLGLQSAVAGAGQPAKP